MIDEVRLNTHLNNGKTEYIMCAANWINDGVEYPHQPYNIPFGICFCGWRHSSIFQQYKDRFPQEKYGKFETQGFLTTKNRFLTRNEALELVKKNGQLKKPLIGSVLTSEDLW